MYQQNEDRLLSNEDSQAFGTLKSQTLIKKQI